MKRKKLAICTALCLLLAFAYYVKEIFELSVSENEKTREKNEEDLEVTNKKHEKSKNKMSRSSKIEPIEVKKINPNNTNKSNTNKSNTTFSKIILFLFRYNNVNFFSLYRLI